MNKKLRILISGGCGDLSTHLQAENREYDLYTPPKKEMDIRKTEDIEKAINYFSPHYFLHCAALTSPMAIHEKNPILSMQTNIIGTANISALCVKHHMKLIYISTDYVYPGTKGDYKEADGLNPFTNYGWSKLGGECSVKMCPDHLILRLAMFEKPFPHPKALIDMIKSPIYVDDGAKIIFQLLDEQGTINVGGKAQSIFDFAKKNNPNVGKIMLNEIRDVNMATDSSMNLDKLKKVLNNEN